jgi:microsomal epoxide hydrolase
MADYSKIPTGALLQPKPFKVNIGEEKLQQMKDFLKIAPIGPATYANTSTTQQANGLSPPERSSGVRRDWLIEAKDQWLNKFDWRKREERLNSFPHFTVPIKADDGHTVDIHFMALFSEKPDAVPLAFYHGWPGSFLEFTKIFELLRQKYSPKDLPYHVIAPSLPNYAFSSGPPVEIEWDVPEASAVLHKLMLGLGFGSGYVAQGGDIGSGICQAQGSRYDECKSIHLNMCPVPQSIAEQHTDMDELEKKAMARGEAFARNGSAYALEHGSRPATIGLVLSSSPLALLAWIGEKFLEWTDEDPPLDEILESISLYWLTDTFPRCIYPYRAFTQGRRERPKISKPSGYSFFPYELFPTPRSQAAAQLNLVAFKQHTSGGHFAVSFLAYLDMRLVYWLIQALGDGEAERAFGGCRGVD